MGENVIHSHQAPIIEVVTRADKVASVAEGSGKALKLISGSEAFRRYDWFKSVPVFNVSGNLRGMVMSPGWRVVFETTSDVLEDVGKVAMIASFAANIAEQAGNIGDVLRSNEPPFLKGLRLASIAGTAAERTLAGVVSSGASMVFQSLQGYCQMAGLAGGDAQSFASACINHLQKANNSVQATFKLVTDTNKQAEAIYWVSAKISSM